MVDVGKYTKHGCYEMWLNPLNFKINTPKNDVFFLFFKESLQFQIWIIGAFIRHISGVYICLHQFYHFWGKGLKQKNETYPMEKNLK